MLRGLAISLILLTGANASAPAPAAKPKAWPPVHTAFQIQYNPYGDEEYNMPWWYDFPNRRLRTDLVLTKGVPSIFPWKPSFTRNFSSYWLNDTLYMYDRGHNFCFKLEQHFGMMMPDWFLSEGAMQQPSVYLTHRSVEPASGHSAFQSCSWMRKDGAGYGWFDYFASEADGAAFRLTAPGPNKGSLVINDFLSMNATSALEDAHFELPEGVTCHSFPGGLDLARLPQELARLEAEASAVNGDAETSAAAARVLSAFGAEVQRAAISQGLAGQDVVV